VISKKPNMNAFEGFGSLTYGNYDYIRADAGDDRTRSATRSASGSTGSMRGATASTRTSTTIGG
jgi:hypothetical protein